MDDDLVGLTQFIVNLLKTIGFTEKRGDVEVILKASSIINLGPSDN